MSEEIKVSQDPAASSSIGVATEHPGGEPSKGGKTQGFSIREYFKGDLGALPVFVALILEAIFFEITTPQHLFLDPGNIYNLVGQTIQYMIIALAAVMVLLLGEIDLSLSAVAPLCGAVMAVLVTRNHWPAVQGMIAALLVGVLIGAVNGFFVAIVRMPSFIVTLAGFIGYQGVLQLILGTQTSLQVYDTTIDAIAVTNLNDFLAITLPLLGLAIYIGATLLQYSRRRSRNLTVQPFGQLLVQLGIVAAVVIGIMVLFASVPNGGTPLAFVLTLVLVAVAWLVLTKTSFGRHVYAVGGNLEAARRAGVRVAGLKIAMFCAASCLAAAAGIYGVSRTTTAFTQLDQSLLLYSIAAAVIGGVSLFGGRGSVWAVIPGALVVYTLVNGLALLNEPAAVVYIVQGAVLLLAVLVDALLRRRGQTGYR